jgi:hypothetical protein
MTTLPLLLMLAATATEPEPSPAGRFPDPTPGSLHLSYVSIDDELASTEGLSWWGEWSQACLPCSRSYDDDTPMEVTLRASSTLEEPQRGYPASHAAGPFEGAPAEARELLSRAWCEGAEGDGVGEWIELVYARPVIPSLLYLSGGYTKSASIQAKNGRVAALRVSADGRELGRVTLDDPTQAHSWGLLRLPDDPAWTTPAKVFRFTIDAVHSGSTHRDTCISLLDLDVIDEVTSKRLE